MNSVKTVAKQTNNPFLNMYRFDVEYRNGSIKPYYFASRSPNIEAKTHEHHSDELPYMRFMVRKKIKLF